MCNVNIFIVLATPFSSQIGFKWPLTSVKCWQSIKKSITPTFEGYIVPTTETPDVNFGTEIDDENIFKTKEEMDERVGFSYITLYKEFLSNFP